MARPRSGKIEINPAKPDTETPISYLLTPI